jgi:hypothetical protein
MAQLIVRGLEDALVRELNCAPRGGAGPPKRSTVKS